MTSIRKLSAAPAMIAALSLTATPVFAADLPAAPVRAAVAAAPAWSPGDDTAYNHRYYRYRYRRGPSAGDVLAGVLIIGGIAAIANAASRANDRRYRDTDYRYPEPRRGDTRDRYQDARGIDRAVTVCASEIERNVRIQSVDTVNRSARGWEVTGSLYNGDGFTCSIGEDGRIDAIDYGRGSQPYRGGYDDSESDRDNGYDDDRDSDDAGYDAAEDRQYDDNYYTQARARIDAQPDYPEQQVANNAAEPEIEYGTGYKGAGTN